MDLLQQYRSCLHNISTIMREQEMNEHNLEQLRQEIADCESKKLMIQASMRSSIDKQSSAQLQKLIQQKRSEILAGIADIEMKLGAVSRKFDQSVQAAKSNQDTSKYKKEHLRLDTAVSILEKGKSAIDTTGNPAITSSIANRLAKEGMPAVTPEKLENLTIEVQQLLNDVPDGEFDNLFEKIVSFILLDIKTFSKLTPGMRAIIYIAYLAVFTGLLIAEPVIFIFPYTSLLMFAGFRNIRTNIKLLNFVYPYKLLEQMANQYCEDLDKRIAEDLNVVLRKLESGKQSELEPLLKQREELSSKLPMVESDVKNNTSLKELIDSAKEEFDKQLQELDSQIAKANANIIRTNKYIVSNDSQLDKAILARDKLKDEIIKSYLNPTKPGDSKLLVRSFFLGIDDNDELIEFNYEGKPTLIIYKGDTSAVNAPLITMMLMQLLSSMSIISLNITLTDTLQGGSSYAVFSPESLSQSINICATSEAVKAAISAYHDEFIMRAKSILSSAESLDAYNELMLSRNSLTRNYWFLFLQDPDIKTLQGQDLLQLLRSGPKAGIIPIIFVNNTVLNDWLMGTEQILLGVKEFIESLDEQLFIYDGDTQDLQFAGVSLKDTILARIKKGLTA